jgi:hypothetical protein
MTVVQASSPTRTYAQSAEPQNAPLAIQVNTGPGFSYQGHLAENGAAVTGVCRFTFGLFDRLASGSQIGNNQEVSGVSVEGGAFALVLNAANQFGDQAFNGQARWLEISVDCGSGATTLSPRQELLAAPYALGLRPGAIISGVVTSNSGLLNLQSSQVGLTILDSGAAGIRINHAGRDGILVCSNAFSSGCPEDDSDNGIEIADADDAGVRVNMADDGFAVVVASDDGVFVGNVGGDGLQVNSALEHGVNVAAANGYGGRFSGQTGGVYAQAAENSAPDLILGANPSGNFSTLGIISSDPAYPNTNLFLRSFNSVSLQLDADNNGQDAAFSVLDAPSNVLFRVTRGGNVGIGTRNPQNRLAMTDESHQMALIDEDNNNKTWTLSTVNQGSGVGVYENGDSQLNRFYIGAGGNVGIGTLNPPNRLAVAASHHQLALVDEDNNNKTWTLSTVNHGNGIGVYENGDSQLNRLYIGAGGNVGIGTLDPQSKLHVAGQATVQILEITGGSDLAERFDIRRSPVEPLPGMLVSIDPDHPGALVISARAYDQTVAGIVSGAGDVKPGMLLGQADTLADGQHPVALTGRVYAWADASEGGPIQPGDLLTTATLPGHAIKVTNHTRAQGAIIGKAMSGLDEGQGLILVLVNLQ